MSFVNWMLVWTLLLLLISGVLRYSYSEVILPLLCILIIILIISCWETIYVFFKDPVQRYLYWCRKGNQEQAIAAVKRLPALGLIDHESGRVFPLHLACKWGLPLLVDKLFAMEGQKKLKAHHSSPAKPSWAKPSFLDSQSLSNSLCTAGINIAVESYRNRNMVPRVIDRGPLIHFLDDGGNTPLHCACLSHNLKGARETVQLLLEKFKVSPGKRNTIGDTPLEVAASCQNGVHQWLRLYQQSKTEKLLEAGRLSTSQENALQTYLQAKDYCADVILSQEIQRRIDICAVKLVKESIAKNDLLLEKQQYRDAMTGYTETADRAEQLLLQNIVSNSSLKHLYRKLQDKYDDCASKMAHALICSTNRHIELQNYEIALLKFEDALQIMSRSTRSNEKLQVLYKTAQCRLKLGGTIHIQKALIEAQECIEIDPYFADGHFLLALLFRAKKHYLKALLYSEQCLSFDPSHCEALELVENMRELVWASLRRRLLFTIVTLIPALFLCTLFWDTKVCPNLPRPLNTESHFSVLNVSVFASEAEIKQAFRIRAQRFHPDKNRHHDTTAKFRRIYEAYKSLTSTPNGWETAVSNEQDLYRILGVSVCGSQADIHQAYIHQEYTSLKRSSWHRVREAYSVLGTRFSRARYDTMQISQGFLEFLPIRST